MTAYLLRLLRVPPSVSKFVLFGDLFVVGVLIIALPYSYLMQPLNYELRWYIVTDRSLRIPSGIWSVEEITMTFANIQDLRITAGPLLGWLGLADLEVSSTGSSRRGPLDANRR